MRIPRTHLLVLVAMCCLVAASVGLLSNVQGIFFDPVASELGVLKGQVSLTLTIVSICGGLAGMLTPRFINTKRIRLLVIVLAAVVGLSTAGFSLCRDIVAMYVLSVIRGFAGGLLGMVFATTILNNWFQSNIGLVTSIAIGCSGISGSAFSLIVSDVVQQSGWRTGYLFVAVLYVILVLPTVFFLPSSTPAACGLVPFGTPAMHVPAGVSSHVEKEAGPVNPLLFGLLVAFAILAHGPAALSQHLPGMADSFGLGASVGATMLAASMITNTVGKIAFGALSDSLGAKRSILIYGTIVTAALAAFLLVHGTGMTIISAAVYGLTFSVNTVGITMSTRELFGQENYAKIYPRAAFAGSLSYAAFASIIGFMYDFTGGYQLALCMVIVMTLAAMGVTQLAYARRQKLEA